MTPLCSGKNLCASLPAESKVTDKTRREREYMECRKRRYNKNERKGLLVTGEKRVAEVQGLEKSKLLSLQQPFIIQIVNVTCGG